MSKYGVKPGTEGDKVFKVKTNAKYTIEDIKKAYSEGYQQGFVIENWDNGKLMNKWINKEL